MKRLSQQNPDVGCISKGALVALSKATEVFIRDLCVAVTESAKSRNPPELVECLRDHVGWTKQFVVRAASSKETALPTLRSDYYPNLVYVL